VQPTEIEELRRWGLADLGMWNAKLMYLGGKTLEYRWKYIPSPKEKLI
jgi:hypothetical protein